MTRVENITGKVLDLRLTEDELSKESRHFPYNYVIRNDKPLIYTVYPKESNNIVGTEIKDEYIEIDDLPNNITDILVNFIKNTKLGKKDENHIPILEISKFYSCIFLNGYIDLKGIKSSWGEQEYNEDKRLIIDYRYFIEENKTILFIEDRFDTIYVEYNGGIQYLDSKIDIEKLLDCLKQKIDN